MLRKPALKNQGQDQDRFSRKRLVTADCLKLDILNRSFTAYTELVIGSLTLVKAVRLKTLLKVLKKAFTLTFHSFVNIAKMNINIERGKRYE